VILVFDGIETSKKLTISRYWI